MGEPDLAVFDLNVPEDRTEAWIKAKGELPETVTLETVKTFLKEKGISHGVVDDARICEYLTQEAFKGKAWLIAKGRSPKPGIDARVTYHFDIDPLKIGTVKTTGVVDFKDKGEISQVREGALLAEKIPIVKEEPGIDVYGQVLLVSAAQDAVLRCGENTKLSDDGLKVLATKGGRPALSADGRFSVYSELEIKGDIGLETGHVQFKGFINVRGAIQEGFQVRGGRLSAKEICKADVEIDGDIVVDGGIIGSKVIGKGNIKARYIHSSIVEAPGDLVVEKEVLHSKIDVNGAFIAHSALASQISAKRGIEANLIGSDASRPCTLVVGVDSISKKLIDKMMREISIKGEEQRRIKDKIDDLRRDSSLLSREIGQLVQIQDRGTIQQRSLKKLAEHLRSQKELVKLGQIEQELKNLEDRIKAAEEPLTNLMDQQTEITEKISNLNEASQKLEEDVRGLENQIQACDQDGDPSVKVGDSILSRTLIQGRHSSLLLEEDHRNVLIREELRTTPHPEENPKPEWKMAISKLKE